MYNHDCGVCNQNVLVILPVDLAHKRIYYEFSTIIIRFYPLTPSPPPPKIYMHRGSYSIFKIFIICCEMMWDFGFIIFREK